MRTVLVCFLLVAGWSSSAFSQQLKEITNSIGMKLVLIHGGSFSMGSPIGALGRKDDEQLHEVTISKSYYIGVYEVTQAQYEEVIAKNPSRFVGSLLPVDSVSWDDAVSFCKELTNSRAEKAAGRV